MKKFWSVAIIFLLSASTSVWAGEIHHKIVEGDCLSKLHEKYHVSVKSIQERNLMGNSTVIIKDSVLWIPVVKTAAIKTQPIKPTAQIAPAKKVSPVEVRKDQKHEKTVHQGVSEYNPKDSGTAKYKGSHGEGAWLLGVVKEEEIGNTTVVLLDENVSKPVDPNQLIKKGDHFLMTSSLHTVGEYVAGWDFFVRKAAVYVSGEFQQDIYVRTACGNLVWHEKKPVPTPPPIIEEKPPVKVKPPVEEPPDEETPSLFVHKKVKKKILRDQEFDGGDGLWWIDDGKSEGDWWYFQYKDNLRKYDTRFAGGMITPVVGAFARGDLGRTDARYKWNNAGIGPEVGVMWNGVTDAGYPQQVQIMFRTMWEHLHGENSASGYAKTEDHFLLGLYAEYLRQFAPDLMHVLYAEGWVDTANSFRSTWGGDKASSRMAFAIGYKFHKQWNDEWASRFGIQVGFADQDDRWSAGANIEMRYNNWLIFGPSLDYTLASAVENAAGGFSYGPFVRVEFHDFATEKLSEAQSAGVQVSDVQLLKY